MPPKRPTPATRNPSYDLVQHIITGSAIPLSGGEFARDIDNAELDQMEHYPSAPAGDGRFSSRSDADINAANLTQAMSLDSAMRMNGEPMDVADQSDNHANPGEGPDSYGRRNTGR